MAKQELDTIADIIDDTSEAKLDSYSGAHLASIAARIEAAEEPDYVIRR